MVGDEFRDRILNLKTCANCREDDRGEFVQVEQENGGLFVVGEVETRLRAFRENRTERKPWNADDE